MLDPGAGAARVPDISAGGEQVALRLVDPATGQHIGDLTFHLEFVRYQPPAQQQQQQQRTGATSTCISAYCDVLQSTVCIAFSGMRPFLPISVMRL